MILAVLLWVAGLVHFQRTHKLETDVAYARKYKAPKQAKAGLSKAANLLGANENKEF